MIRIFRPLAAAMVSALLMTAPASAQSGTYTADEIIGAGHQFFGGVSTGLAKVVERAVSKYGLPNGYILGQEGAGAFFAGARYGEGWLYTK
ncbi:MAG TPA: EipA family protein, partial [Dongiaceae bacterium]